MRNGNHLARLLWNGYTDSHAVGRPVRENEPGCANTDTASRLDGCPGKEETPAPICREQQRKDFRGLRAEYLTTTAGVQERPQFSGKIGIQFHHRIGRLRRLDG